MTLHQQLVEIQKIETLAETDQVVCEMSPELEAAYFEVQEAMENQAHAFAHAQRLLSTASAKATIFFDRLRIAHERFESADAQGKAPGIRRRVSDGKLILTLDQEQTDPENLQEIVGVLQEVIARLQP